MRSPAAVLSALLALVALPGSATGSTPRAGLGRAVPPALDERGPAGSAPDQPPARRRYVVAALGDSLTDPRSGGGGYLRELGRRCPGSEFHALGVGGQRTDHFLWRFPVEVLGRGARRPPPRFTHLIVLGGVNDLLSRPLGYASTDRVEKNLGELYRRGAAAGLTTIAITVPPWGRLRGATDRRVEATDRLNAWVLAQEGLGRVDHAVDVRAALTCGEEGVLCPALRRFASDGIHWGEAGHAVVGALLHEQVFSDCL